MKAFQRRLINFNCTAFPVALIFLVIQALSVHDLRAQIYEPEGLNMPGAWNSWTNPPANNLALASNTQVPGGRVVKFSTGIQRWQTMFSVAETGGDIAGGTYEWLFTSGSSSNYYQNKWSAVTVSMNTLQPYTKEGSSNNNITLVNGKWYTMNFEDAGYTNTRAIFMETSAQPGDITTVSGPSVVNTGNPATIAVTLSQIPATEEQFYLRYTTNLWISSSLLPLVMTGTSGVAQIPPQPVGTVVSYYVFSSTIPAISADYDLYTIKLNTNGGLNYGYTVTDPPPVITFANLQQPPSGTIDPQQTFQVHGRAGIPGLTGQPTPAPGLEAWVGYSSGNSDPATWTNWMQASYVMPVAGYDEFSANLGVAMTVTGTYYYATRFRVDGGSYVYGGYSASGGGYWDGTTNVSGILTVQTPVVPLLLALENITVASEQSVCYNAKNTITVAGNNTFFNVMEGGSATLVSGGNIIFLPGASVDSGGYLLGYITSQGNYCNPLELPVLKTAGTTGPGKLTPEALSFRVYPNPATTEVTVEMQRTPGDAGTRLELTGVRGNHISSHVFAGPGKYSIVLDNIPSGIYLLKIISGEQVQTRKLVKL